MLHNLERTLHLQTFLLTYTVSCSYLVLATYILFSPYRVYAKYCESIALLCLTIFILKYFQQCLNNSAYEEKDQPIGLERDTRKKNKMKIKLDGMLLLKYAYSFTASRRSPIDFSGTTDFLKN